MLLRIQCLCTGTILAMVTLVGLNNFLKLPFSLWHICETWHTSLLAAALFYHFLSKFAENKRSRQPDEEDSGEETDGNTSSHSRSSHGDNDDADEPRKPKRTRTAYSNHQLDQLELAFSRSHYPDVFTREDLSTKLNIKEDRIQV